MVKAVILFHLCSASIFITLLVAYVIHGLIYPRVSGDIPLGPYTVDYKVGRVPFFTYGQFSINLYHRWWVVKDMTDFLATSGKGLRYETKSMWEHMGDCGLLYPAVFVYAWTGVNYLLFG
ncbi:hypothetical protein D3C81_1777650 [compost metagenome]